MVAALLPALVVQGTSAPNIGALSALALEPPGWQPGPGTLTPNQRFFVLEKEGRPFLDEMLLRTFYNEAGGSIEAQIFYHHTRRDNAWGDFADMVNCWHGRFHKVTQREVSLAQNAKANLLVMERENEHAVALYWMQSAGRTSASGWAHVLWQHVQALLMRRSDACFVKLSYSGPRTPGRDATLTDVGRHVHKRLARWLKEGEPGSEGPTRP